MIAAPLLAAMLAIAPQQPGAQTQLLDPYVDEWVLYRFGGAMSCDPPGEKRLFAKVRKRLSAIRTALIARYGQAAVMAADSRIDPQFEVASGDVSIAGCPINNPASDRTNLRALTERHDEALDALESALGLTKKGRR